MTEVIATSPVSPVGPDTLTSVTALARFEFEPGRGNEGTKVMMVEWQDDDKSRPKDGKWQVSWHGKRTVFPADDEPTDNIRRVYFLLPPGATIPPHVSLAYHSPANPSSTEQTPPLKMAVNPLPAIFTPELGATAKAAGKKGVLHTIWAKKRLQVLEREIKQESEHNLEGIALEMAQSEKTWIEKNFGIATKPPTLDLTNLAKPTGSPTSPGLISPRSPGGRRLTDKLKGLSIGTSEKDLARPRINTVTRESNPLSPEASDIAHSSFSVFRGGPAPVLGRKIGAQAPPEHIQKMQEGAPSLDFISSASVTQKPLAATEDDLFAVALSPRSPDDPKSPFSMSSAEVGALSRGAFSKIKGER